MNWQGCGRKWPWTNLRFYSGIFPEWLRKTTKKPQPQQLDPRHRFETWTSPEHMSKAVVLEPTSLLTCVITQKI
jgi:hypothetical protein